MDDVAIYSGKDFSTAYDSGILSAWDGRKECTVDLEEGSKKTRKSKCSADEVVCAGALQVQAGRCLSILGKNMRKIQSGSNPGY